MYFGVLKCAYSEGGVMPIQQERRAAFRCGTLAKKIHMMTTESDGSFLNETRKLFRLRKDLGRIKVMIIPDF
jgi:hypothetical protein